MKVGAKYEFSKCASTGYNFIHILESGTTYYSSK